MKFIPTTLEGAFVIEIEPRADDRGFFARTFCQREFADHGLVANVAQCNVAFTELKGTLRGMHYQVPPSTETKILRCTRGGIYDVMVDLRPGSPTYFQHFGIELRPDTRRAIYVPPMFGHGYQTLADDTEVTYLMGDFYDPACERGFRHDDPALNIKWPEPITKVSDRDMEWPFLTAR